MDDSITAVRDFPKPDIVAQFRVYADEHRILLRYWSDDKIAVLFFPSYTIFKLGAPNDEVIRGHPLHTKGLELYAAQKVENSSWIKELEKQNSVHHSHYKEMFAGLNHYIFTGQDRTFECVVSERRKKTEVHLVDKATAKEVWEKYLQKMD